MSKLLPNWKLRCGGSNRARATCLLAVALVAGIAGQAQTQVNALVTRIEEDWEIVLGTPNPDEAAPQLINVISPTAGLGGMHGIFEINHSTLPAYRAGGVQLQTWYAENEFDYCDYLPGSPLTAQDEIVRYTFGMQIGLDEQMQFEVFNGSSYTWGDFGGRDALNMVVPATVNHMTGYSTEHSIANAQIGYGKHKVRKWVLKEVRYYTLKGLFRTDPTDRVVFEHVPST